MIFPNEKIRDFHSNVRFLLVKHGPGWTVCTVFPWVCEYAQCSPRWALLARTVEDWLTCWGLMVFAFSRCTTSTVLILLGLHWPWYEVDFVLLCLFVLNWSVCHHVSVLSVSWGLPAQQDMWMPPPLVNVLNILSAEALTDLCTNGIKWLLPSCNLSLLTSLKMRIFWKKTQEGLKEGQGPGYLIHTECPGFVWWTTPCSGVYFALLLEAVSGCLLCGRAGGLGHSDHTGKVPCAEGQAAGRSIRKVCCLVKTEKEWLGWGRGHTEACVTGWALVQVGSVRLWSRSEPLSKRARWCLLAARSADISCGCRRVMQSLCVCLSQGDRAELFHRLTLACIKCRVMSKWNVYDTCQKACCKNILHV